MAWGFPTEAELQASSEGETFNKLVPLRPQRRKAKEVCLRLTPKLLKRISNKKHQVAVLVPSSDGLQPTCDGLHLIIASLLLVESWLKKAHRNDSILSASKG